MCKTLGNYTSQWHPLKMSGMYPTLALIYATLVVVETEDPHQLLLESWRLYALALILSHLELSEQCFSSIFEAPSVPLYQCVCRNTIWRAALENSQENSSFYNRLESPTSYTVLENLRCGKAQKAHQNFICELLVRQTINNIIEPTDICYKGMSNLITSPFLPIKILRCPSFSTSKRCWIRTEPSFKYFQDRCLCSILYGISCTSSTSCYFQSIWHWELSTHMTMACSCICIYKT